MLDVVSALYWLLPELNAQAGKQEPPTITEEMLAYADGVNWNPGSGRGFYKYLSGWKLIARIGFFESAEQTITTGTDIAVAHGLGAVPKMFKAIIRCKTAQAGYAVGDEVEPLNLPNQADRQHTLGTYVNATNIGYVVGNLAIRISERTGGFIGDFVTITPANWKLVLRAWA